MIPNIPKPDLSQSFGTPEDVLGSIEECAEIIMDKSDKFRDCLYEFVEFARYNEGFAEKTLIKTLLINDHLTSYAIMMRSLMVLMESAMNDYNNKF